MGNNVKLKVPAPGKRPGKIFERLPNEQNAFALLEILIMVGVVALMAAILIPGLLRSNAGANEASAQSTLKSLAMACERYREAQRVPSYDPADNAAHMTAAGGDYIDPGVFAAQGKDGYVFTYVAGAAIGSTVETYDCSARPVKENVSGIRWFVIDESGVLREDANKSGTAEPDDPIIQ